MFMQIIKNFRFHIIDRESCLYKHNVDIDRSTIIWKLNVIFYLRQELCGFDVVISSNF